MISSILLSTLVTAYGGNSDCYRTVCYFCQAKSGGGCTYDHYKCQQSDQCLREGEVCTANYDCSKHCASCGGYSTSYASGSLNKYAGGNYAGGGSNSYDSSNYAGGGSNSYASGSSNNYASSSSNNYASSSSKKYSGGDSKKYSGGDSKKYSGGGSKKYSGGGKKKYSGGGKTYTGDDEGGLQWWHILLIVLGVLLLLGVLGYLYFTFFGKKKDFDEEAKSQPSHLDFDASTSRALPSRNLLSPTRNLAPPRSPTYKSKSPTSKSPTNKGKSPAKNKFGWVAE